MAIAITPSVSFIKRILFIETGSSKRKLFVCIYIEKPQKETENEINANFRLLYVKFKAEIYFAALLTSIKDSAIDSFTGSFIKDDASPDIIEKNTMKPHIARVPCVAFLIDETSEKDDDMRFVSMRQIFFPIPKSAPAIIAEITEEK